MKLLVSKNSIFATHHTPPPMNYIELNRDSWNKRTGVHVQSDFYGVKDFLAGQSTLNSIELDLLGDLQGKNLLHLQCHFGMDTLSLARLGARVTGIDLSDAAIDQARQLAEQQDIPANFICCNIYDLPDHLDEQFDVVRLTLIVTVDSRDLPLLFDRISRQNLYVCTHVDLTRSNDPLFGFVYGPEPVIRATMDFECYMARSAFAEMMPPDVLKALGGNPPEPTNP